jgi:hypothetical protein
MPGRLEPRHERPLGGEVAVPDEHVSPLDPGVSDTDGNLPGPRGRLGYLGEAELVVGVQYNGFHGHSLLF